MMVNGKERVVVVDPGLVDGGEWLAVEEDAISRHQPHAH